MRIAILSILLVAILIHGCNPKTQETKSFDSNRAYNHIAYQMSLGPRPIGSEAHQKTIDYIYEELASNGWSVTTQKATVDSGINVQNIIGERGDGRPWIILGTHYDTRIFADRDTDPQNHSKPVPGANDGASGVAVLLELGRSLPEDLKKQVWLCFFDAEDNGNIEGYDWILGSTAFVESLSEYPDSAVIVDMVGDENLTLYLEMNSNPDLVVEIWDTASSLGKSQFIKEWKHTILDDHVPFLEVGIPAIDIIDIQYPYWHTTSDTIDKVSAESLAAVGETLFAWLIR